MPFREKIAWISLLTMLGVFGAFYLAVVTGLLPSRGMGAFHWFLMSVVAVIVLHAGLSFAAAATSRGDAGSPKDEREQLIELKATRIAFYVLTAGVLTTLFVGIHLPFGHRHIRPPEFGFLVTAAVILADVVKSAAQIIYFRRGA